MNDGLSWSAAIDTTNYDAGIEHIESGISKAASDAENESKRIQSLFTNIPEIDIKAVTNMPQTADEIGEAYATIERVTRENQSAISDLEAEYNRLTQQINKFQNVPSKSDDVKKWRDERKAIQENVSIRKELIAKTKELTKAVDENAAKFDKQNKSQMTVKSQMRAVMQEMANLRNEAQKNGVVLDESTGRYRELAEELGRKIFKVTCKHRQKYCQTMKTNFKV
jgi:HAMP domain-containing protein